MTFTEQAKDQAQASWQGSFQHPFITELHEGTLSPTIFRYYLIQDHYYLKHFSQLYRLIAAQTQQPRLKKLLLTNAENLALGELAIRDTFFEELAITEEEVAATPIAPTAYHYVSHMYRQLIEGTPKTSSSKYVALFLALSRNWCTVSKTTLTRATVPTLDRNLCWGGSVPTRPRGTPTVRPII